MPPLRRAAALALLIFAVAGCSRHDAQQPSSSATRSGPSRRSLADVASQPQPVIPMTTAPPVVQDLAPGTAQLGTDLIAVDVTRVTYSPYGVGIDAVARQAGRVLGGKVYLNYADRGVLRYDRGNTYRLRDPEDRLITRLAGADDRWRLHLVALGFVPADAKRLTLGLDINSLGTHETLVETGWTIPPAVAGLRRVAPADSIRPRAG